MSSERDTGCIHDYMRNCPSGCHHIRAIEAERDRYRAALEEISGMPATGGVAAAAMIEVADEALGEGGQHEH